MAQDQVFGNCASGRQTPDPAPDGAPVWLQKDRAYQLAAASFYSLDFTDAKRRFAEIAQDGDSPWQETADYLLARTLIRQASLSKDESKAGPLYDEAEEHLKKFISRSGKFSGSSERLTGLIKYRRHPKERVSELAKQLAFYGGGENFRQDVIDYNWLLDKFESETLDAEEKSKSAASEDERKAKIIKSLSGKGISITVSVANGEVTLSGTIPKAMVAEAMMSAAEGSPTKIINNLNRTSDSNPAVDIPDNTPGNTAGMTSGSRKSEDIAIYLSSEDLKQHWTLYVDRGSTDEEALAAAKKLVGTPLTEEMKKRVRESRRSGYAEHFSTAVRSGYQGGFTARRHDALADARFSPPRPFDRLAIYLSDARP